jgi:hypothetical protein
MKTYEAFGGTPTSKENNCMETMSLYKRCHVQNFNCHPSKNQSNVFNGTDCPGQLVLQGTILESLDTDSRHNFVMISPFQRMAPTRSNFHFAEIIYPTCGERIIWDVLVVVGVLQNDIPKFGYIYQEVGSLWNAWILPAETPSLSTIEVFPIELVWHGKKGIPTSVPLENCGTHSPNYVAHLRWRSTPYGPPEYLRRFVDI